MGFDLWFNTYYHLSAENLNPEQFQAFKEKMREVYEAAQPQWQPIETAPNNTHIIVYAKLEDGSHGLIHAIFRSRTESDYCDLNDGYSEEHSEWLMPVGWYEITNAFLDQHLIEFGENVIPLYWQPMPSLPKED